MLRRRAAFIRLRNDDDEKAFITAAEELGARPVLGTQPRGLIKHTSQRIAAAATALLAVATPAVAHTPEPAPPAEPPGEVQWPPASTHGKFLPYPDGLEQPCTLPACGSEITTGPVDADESEYRALVTAEGTRWWSTAGPSQPTSLEPPTEPQQSVRRNTATSAAGRAEKRSAGLTL